MLTGSSAAVAPFHHNRQLSSENLRTQTHTSPTPLPLANPARAAPATPLPQAHPRARSLAPAAATAAAAACASRASPRAQTQRPAIRARGYSSSNSRPLLSLLGSCAAQRGAAQASPAPAAAAATAALGLRVPSACYSGPRLLLLQRRGLSQLYEGQGLPAQHVADPDTPAAAFHGLPAPLADAATSPSDGTEAAAAGYSCSYSLGWPETATAATADMDPFQMGLSEVVAALAPARGGAAAAAAAAAAEAVGKPAEPSVDVTRHNFETMLPAVRAYLGACDYYSFDCEMTGLFLDGANESYLDDLQDRYTRTAAAAQSFVINQFGLSCFKRLPVDPASASAPGEGQGQARYAAATFNFYLFPRPAEGLGLSTKRFTSDAGSLAFLAGQGFDFNRCIYDGVPFMPARTRDQLLQKMQRFAPSAEGSDRPTQADVALTDPRDAAFVQGLLDTVQGWLAGGGEEALLLPPSNAFQRLLTYQALARPSSFPSANGHGDAKWHPGFFVQKVAGPYGTTQLRLVRGNAEDAARQEAEERQAKVAELQAATGFAQVFEAMRNCGRPAVGHNCAFDVAYALAQFAEPQLPPTWSAYKALVAAWFRGGLYDTKHIARQPIPALEPLLQGDTMLATVFGCLQRLTAEGGTGPCVRIEHAPGFEKYVAVAAGQLAHEAGYDAFMTGSAFAGLEAVLAAQASSAAAAPPPAPFASVLPYAWRLNMSRSDYPYALMRPAQPGEGPQLPPERPHVLYLGSLSPGVRAGDIHKRTGEAGVGKVRITFLPGNHCLLELQEPPPLMDAEALVGRLQGTQLAAEVLPYGLYTARKEAMLVDGTWPGLAPEREGGGMRQAKRPRVQAPVEGGAAAAAAGAANGAAAGAGADAGGRPPVGAPAGARPGGWSCAIM